MKESSSRPNLEALLEHGGWVHSLVRSLVSDVAAAEDVEQRAWLDALERPPKNGSNLRSWLGAVVRNKARMHWRESNARQRREAFVRASQCAEAAANESERRPDSLVERKEIFGKVSAALLELDEPFSSTLFLRFCEGLTLREIAQQYQVSESTVHARIERGLKMLRERLAADFGAGWRSRCLVLTFPLAAKSAASLITAFVMTTKVLLFLGVVAIALVYWFNGNSLDTPGDSPNGAVASLPESGSLERAIPEVESRSITRIGTQDGIANHLQSSRYETSVICQTYLEGNRRSPLANVTVSVQLGTSESTEPFSRSKSSIRGVANVLIPIGQPFSIIGVEGEVTARREIEALTLTQFQEMFPNGIYLDFFMGECRVNYSMFSRKEAEGIGLFLSVGPNPFPTSIITRQSDRSHFIKIGGNGIPATGSFSVQAGSEVFWAVHDGFGVSIASGRSQKVLNPGDVFEVDIDLRELAFPDTRYFRVTQGSDLLEGPFMNSMSLDVYDQSGSWRGSVQGVADEVGEFSAHLPSLHSARFVIRHHRAQAVELPIGETDGISAEDPIELSLNAATRVLFRKTDFPEMEAREQVTFVDENGFIGRGYVSAIPNNGAELEILGGWHPGVHSIRIANRLFLVSLSNEQEVRLPGSQFHEVIFPEVVPCEVSISATTKFEQTVFLKFNVRGEHWQVFRVRKPGSDNLRFTAELPFESGTVSIREGFGELAVLPYSVGPGGEVYIRWDNR